MGPSAVDGGVLGFPDGREALGRGSRAPERPSASPGSPQGAGPPPLRPGLHRTLRARGTHHHK